MNTNNTAAIDKQKRSMGLKASARISNTIIYIVLVIVSIIWLIPFVCIVLQSFRMESTGRVGYVLPQVWGLGNYKKLFDPSTNFIKWYLNTFIIALVVAVVLLGMFPGMLAMIILYRVLDDLHLTGQYGNAVPGLILVYVASSGMGYYVSKGFFDTIPKSLDEAARVDGANRAQVLVKIILPLAKPIVIYTVLTAFMGPWGDFVFARYVSQVIPKAMNVAVGLQSWLATDTMVHDNYTLFCAGGVVVALPVAILFMCLQRYYVEGVTGGAVKG